MSVGGKVKDVLIHENRVFINTIDDGYECAIYVERDRNSERVSSGDTVWWQGERAYWTTEDEEIEECTLKRRGFSGVPWPHDVPVVEPKYLQGKFLMIHADADIHLRTLTKTKPTSRKRCSCGCNKRSTHLGRANGVGMMSGCELVVRRWVKNGY